MLLIAQHMTPEQQGWYYSFLTLTTPYLFDLGLSNVAMQLAAHDKARSILGQGGFQGAYFRCLIAKMFRWYFLLGVCCVALLLPLGTLFFRTSAPFSTWFPQWVVLVLITGIGLMTIPYLSIAEGRGRIRDVYVLRLLQGLIGATLCWLVLASGGGLWSVELGPMAGLLVSGIWIFRQWHWIGPAIRDNDQEVFKWRQEIWPLQWRLGLNLLCGYLLTQIYTPILFHFHGGVAAGQMGLSLAIANTVGLIAQSWVARHVPAMGGAAACGDWITLDRLFSRDFAISSAAFLLGASVLCAARLLLTNSSFDSRVLPQNQFLMLFGVIFVNHVVGCLSAHLRSFRQEPLVWVAIVGVLLAVPIGTVAAQYYSSGGVICTLFVVNVFIELPMAIWLWHRCNREWRR